MLRWAVDNHQKQLRRLHRYVSASMKWSCFIEQHAPNVCWIHTLIFFCYFSFFHSLMLPPPASQVVLLELNSLRAPLQQITKLEKR